VLRKHLLLRRFIKMVKKIKAAIKVDFGNSLRLGAGKIRLLTLVAETGSISAAAREMEMSYRRAWLLIGEMNEMFGSPVVETSAGGSGGGGAKITEHGKKLIAVFDELQTEADQLVRAKLARF
jgi:molybdate transport system regulatory protein